MNLIPVERPEDFLLARQFLFPHEESCVSLASLVRKKSDKLVFLTKSENAVIPSSSSHLLGILNLDSTIYYCIPDTSQINAGQLADLLNSSGLLKKQVRCISGEKSGSELLSKSINLIYKTEAAQKYLYKMMKLPSSKTELPAQDLFNGDEIIRCTENDMERLHQIQKEYMKEEVAVPGRQISDAEVSLMLRQILKNQLCFAMLTNGEPAAKANTNAIGFNCVQIGGVYTQPLYRRNGYAAALVTALCKRALRASKHPVLFVKEKNTPALTLYQKIGFEECGGYEILYY